MGRPGSRSSSRSTWSHVRWHHVEISPPRFGSCVAALLRAWATTRSTRRRNGRSNQDQERTERRRMATRLRTWTITPRCACCVTSSRRPDAILVNEGANALDGARRDRHVSAAQASRCRHLGRDGLCHRRDDRDPQADARHRGRQRVWPLRRGSQDNLPLQPAVCVVVFNNDGVPAATASSWAAAPTRRHHVRHGRRYDKMIEGFGGVGVNVTTRTN